MKKLIFLFLIPALLFCGCGNDYVKSNMAEITNLFFVGQAEDDYGSISVGEREINYQKDGICGKTCPFSLISLAVSGYFLMFLDCNISINGVSQQIQLENVGGNYMFDLEYALLPSDSVEIEYMNRKMTFSRKDFAISPDDAIELAKKELKTEIDSHKNDSEFYLQVLREERAGLPSLFWGFTMVTRDKQTFTCVVDTNTGEIIK